MKLLLIFSTILPLLQAPVVNLSWAVSKESTVSISGSSNVNHFTFQAKEYEGSDTLVMNLKTKGQKFIFDKGLLQLPVKNFKNSNPMITKDFKKTLKYKNYPNILMNFRTINGLHHDAEAEVEISLAGKTIARCIKLEATQRNNNLYLQGKEKLKFSDFGLQPPQKILGFIDVKNELDVDFCLVLKQVKS